MLFIVIADSFSPTINFIISVQQNYARDLEQLASKRVEMVGFCRFSIFLLCNSRKFVFASKKL